MDYAWSDGVHGEGEEEMNRILKRIRSWRYGHGLVFFNKNYGWEIEWLTFMGLGGLYLIDLSCNISFPPDDHSPGLYFRFELFNFTIIDFSVYNIYHRDEEGNIDMTEDEEETTRQ